MGGSCNLPPQLDPQSKNCQDLDPQESCTFDFAGKQLSGKTFFMSYARDKQATISSCNGQIFCQGLEVSSPSRNTWNFDSQYMYSFPVSLAFTKNGNIVPECPLDATSGPLPDYCSNGVTCKSSKGQPETCNFDYGRTCPDTAWKL